MGVLSPSTRMQNTLAITLACLVSAISAEVTCDDCLEFSGNMQSHLMSSESVAEQTELLVSILCPTSPDVAECEDGFRTWWTPIAGAMFPLFLENQPARSAQAPLMLWLRLSAVKPRLLRLLN